MQQLKLKYEADLQTAHHEQELNVRRTQQQLEAVRLEFDEARRESAALASAAAAVSKVK